MRINNTTELQPKDTRKKVIYLEAALWPSVSVTVPWLIILNGRCSIAMFTTMRAALESTRINIFGVCVSESVQDRENEIHVKDGGDGLLSPFRSVCWSIWTCIFHSNTSCRQLEQEVCVCVGGGSCDVLTERRMGGGAICPKNNHMNQCSSTLLWRGRESEWEHRGWREKRVRQWLKITVCVGYLCICVCDMCLIRANLDCFSSNCMHTDI